MFASHRLAPIALLTLLSGTVLASDIQRVGHLGGLESRATDVNNAGQVVGQSLLGNGLYHAFFWDNGTLTDLDPLRPGVESIAHGLNDVGDIVGQADDFASPRTAMLWNGSGTTDLGAAMGATGATFAYSINNSGLIAGQVALTPSFSLPSLFDTSGNLFFNQTQRNYDGGALLDVNEQGVSVGYDFIFLAPGDAIVVAPDGSGGFVGPLGLKEQDVPQKYPYSQAHALNEMGTIVGVSNNGFGTEQVARWNPVFDTGGPRGLGEPGDPGGPGGPGGGSVSFEFEVLGTLDGYEGGVAADINETGMIVGWAFNFEGPNPQRAFAYVGDRFFDLNDTLQPGDDFQYLIRATGVNDNGDIVGFGITTDGNVEGFLISGFVPAPGAAALFGLAGIGAMRRRRR